MNIIKIAVANPDELLNTDAYGAGAFIEIQRTATPDDELSWAQIGTVALVAETNVYTFYDTAGLTTSWYRSRYSKANASILSEWSETFQASTDAQLTVDDLERLFGTDTDDEDYQRLLSAATEEVDAYIGSLGTITEYNDGGYPRLALRYRASDIESVTETTRSGTVTTLATDDYRVRADGYVLERLITGTNARSRWYGLVTITYNSVEAQAMRQQAILDLVALGLQDTSSSVGAERIGEYSYSTPTSIQVEADRRAILSRLRPDPGIWVVGGPTSVIIA